MSYHKVGKIATTKTSSMTKLHFIRLIGDRGLYLSTKEIEKLALLAFGISQSKSVNISKDNDRILQIERECGSKESQYKSLLKPFQTGDYGNLVKNGKFYPKKSTFRKGMTAILITTS